MSFVLPWAYNKYVSSHINNSNSITSTYKNVSLLVDGNTNLQDTTISRLGVGKDTNPSYTVDINGGVNLVGGGISINGTAQTFYTANMDASFNYTRTVRLGINTPVSGTYNLDVAGDVNITGTYYVNGTPFSGGITPWQDASFTNVDISGNLVVKSTGKLIITYDPSNQALIKDSDNDNIVRIDKLVNSNYFGKYNKQTLTGGQVNMCMGQRFCENSTDASYCYGFGHQNYRYITNPFYNIAMGFRALRGPLTYGTTPTDNIAIGHDCMPSITSGTKNTSMGMLSMFSVSSGGYNTCVGEEAGYNNTTGSYNTYLGYLSGPNINPFQAGTGQQNTAVGNSSGLNITNHSYNTLLGGITDVSFGSSGLQYSTALGYGAKILESNKIYLGRDTEETIAVGGLKIPTSMNMNVYGNAIIKSGGKLQIEYDASQVIIFDGDNNKFINIDKSKFSNYFGNSNNQTFTSGQYNMVMGQQFGTGLTDASYCYSFGFQNYKNLQSPSRNIAIGHYTLGGLTNTTPANPIYNVAIGHSSMAYIAGGTYNVAVGHDALGTNQNGDFNTVVGQSAGRQVQGNYNTHIGYETSSNLNTSGDYNTTLGALSGFRINGNQGLTLIGYGTDEGYLTGTYNYSTALGFGAVISESNKIFLGRDTEETIAVGGLRIPTSTNLDIQGNITANSTTITPTEVGYLDGVSSNIQTQLNSKGDVFLNGTNNFTGTNTFGTTLNPEGLIISSGSFLNLLGDIRIGSTGSPISGTEISYLDGATSNIQTQLSGKATRATTNTFTDTNTFTKSGGGTGIEISAGTNINLLGNITANALTITPTELGYIDGTTSNIQTQLNSKGDVFLSSANTFTNTNTFTKSGGGTGITISAGTNMNLLGNITANSTTITPVELGYIDGLTSNAQTQLTGKATLSTLNTFTQKNTFDGGIAVSGGSGTTIDVPTTQSFVVSYNGTAIIEVGQYALYSPLSISNDFNQITYNASSVFRSPCVISSDLIVGDPYIAGSFQIGTSATVGTVIYGALATTTHQTGATTTHETGTSETYQSGALLTVENPANFDLGPVARPYSPYAVFGTITNASVNWDTTPPASFSRFILFSNSGTGTITLTLPQGSNASVFLGMEFVFRRTNTFTGATTTSLLSVARGGTTDLIYIAGGMTTATSTIVLPSGGYYSRIVYVATGRWAYYPS